MWESLLFGLYGALEKTKIKIKDPGGCVALEQRGLVHLDWEGGCLQIFRRSAMDGSGASRDSLELEDKEEGASLDWRNPTILWLRRTPLQWRLQMRNQRKSRKPGKASWKLKDIFGGW